MSLGEGFFIHSKERNNPSFLGMQPACHRPFHHMPSFVPTEVQQPRRSEDIGLQESVDRMPLEGKRKPCPRKGPRNLNLPNAMLRAGDPGNPSMEPGKELAMIEVSPTPGGKVIINRPRLAALRASERHPRPMLQGNIETLVLGGQRNLMDPPGLLQSQQMRHEVNVTHGPTLLGGDSTRSLPTRKSDEPKKVLASFPPDTVSTSRRLCQNCTPTIACSSALNTSI
jgi:hypothetical protein